MRKATQTGLFDTDEKVESWLEGFGKKNDGLKPVATIRKEKKHMGDELRGMDAVASALERMNENTERLIHEALGRSRGRGRGRDREEEPESVRDMQDRGRQGEARQVAFEVKVPVGRNGGTLKGLLIFDVSVRDDRDLEDLANEVERKFRSANVFTKDFNRGGYGGGNGYNGGGGGWNGGGGGWNRDREWRR